MATDLFHRYNGSLMSMAKKLLTLTQDDNDTERTERLHQSDTRRV